MRASAISFSKKALSAFFAAALTLGLLPITAFADDADAARADASASVQEEPIFDGSFTEGAANPDAQKEAVSTEDAAQVSEAAIGDALLPAGGVIDQEVAPDTLVAQVESTKSFFLASAMENTRAVPMMSAKLPLGEGIEDALPDADHVVTGSFTYRGITYAMEPGGESVAIVAVDYDKLPAESIEARIIVLPSVVSADGIDSFSVSRIAKDAFSSLTREAALSTSEPVDGSDDQGALGITAITIPVSVSSIEEGAFAGFETLRYAIVSADNPNYSMYDGCLYDADRQSLLLIPEGRVGAVRIAPSATQLDPEVFSHCPSLDKLLADADSAAFKTLGDVNIRNRDGEALEVALDPGATALDAAYDSTIEVEEGDTIDLAVELGLASSDDVVVPPVLSTDILRFDDGELKAFSPGTVEVALDMLPAQDERFVVATVVVDALEGSNVDPETFAGPEEAASEDPLSTSDASVAELDGRNVLSAVSYDVHVGTPMTTYCGSHSISGTQNRVAVLPSAGWYVRNVGYAPTVSAMTGVNKGGVQVSGFGCGQSGCSYATWGSQQAVGSGYGSGITKVEYWDPVIQGWLYVAPGSSITPSFRRVTSLYVRVNGYSSSGISLPKGYVSVNWNSNGGSAVTGWDVRIDSPLAGNNYTTGLNTTNPALPVPTRTGYTFAGWYTSNTDFSSANKVSMSTAVARANVTYYAKWTPNPYTVQYESNYAGGPAAQEQTRSYDESLVPLSVSRPGYELLGWSREPLEPQESLPEGAIGKDQSFSIKSDIEFSGGTPPASFPLYAIWKIVPYSLVIKTTGDSVSGFGSMELSELLEELGATLSADKRTITATYTYESEDILLPDVSPADGWKLSAWNLVLDGVDKGSASAPVTVPHNSIGDRTYTAEWAPDVGFSISYDLGEALDPAGMWPDPAPSGTACPSVYDVTDSFTLPSPVREGHVFTGWTVVDEGSATQLSSDGMVATVPRGSYGNKAFTANWLPVLYIATLNIAKDDLPGVDDAVFEEGIPTSLTGPAFEFKKEEVRRADGTLFSADQVTSISEDGKTITVPFTYASSGFDLPTGLGLAGSWSFGGWKDQETSAFVSSIPERSAKDRTLFAVWTPIVSMELPIEGGFGDEADVTIQLDVATGKTGFALGGDDDRATRTLFRTKTPVPASLSAYSKAPVKTGEDGVEMADDDYVKAFFYGDDGDIDTLVSSLGYSFKALCGIDESAATELSFARREGRDGGIKVLSATDGDPDEGGYVSVEGILDLTMDPVASSKINDTLRIHRSDDPELASKLAAITDQANKKVSTIVWTVDATGWDA